ncbi:uncharacterized protein CCOS01_15075, partial [Colletotrichum costaricense]
VSRLTLPSPCPACGVRHGSVQTYPPPLEIPELQNLHTPRTPKRVRASAAQLDFPLRLASRPAPTSSHHGHVTDITRQAKRTSRATTSSIPSNCITSPKTQLRLRLEEYSTKAKAVKTQG